MAKFANKITTLLVLLAFIPTSTNLNYVSSYISRDKDALRGMSASKYTAMDIGQALSSLPKKIEVIPPPARESSAGISVTIDKLEFRTEDNIRFLTGKHGLRSSNNDIRLDAAESLSILGNDALERYNADAEEVIAVLVYVLENTKDRWKRVRAAAALSRFDIPILNTHIDAGVIIKNLIRPLSGNSPLIITYATNGLFYFLLKIDKQEMSAYKKVVISALSSLCENRNPLVKTAAISALYRFDKDAFSKYRLSEEETLRLLSKNLKSGAPLIKTHAAQALSVFYDEPYSEFLPEVKETADVLSGEYGLKSGQLWIMASAADALFNNLNGTAPASYMDNAIDGLTGNKGLKSKYPWLRVHAEVILHKIGIGPLPSFKISVNYPEGPFSKSVNIFGNNADELAKGLNDTFFKDSDVISCRALPKEWIEFDLLESDNPEIALKMAAVKIDNTGEFIPALTSAISTHLTYASDIPAEKPPVSEESDKASSSGRDKGPLIQDTVKELQQLINTGDVNIPEYKDFIKRAIKIIEIEQIEQQRTGKEKETLKAMDTARLGDGLTSEKAPDSIMAVYNNISLESIAVYTERKQGSEEKLRQLEMINYILLKYLHNKIGLADSSVKSSPAGNSNNIQAAIQITPETEPGDLMFAFKHSKEAPKVVINDPGVKEFMGLTAERSNQQLKAFLEAGFEAVVVLGELPVEYEGISYLLSGKRKFPDTLSGMLTALSIIEKTQLDNPESFKPAYYFQLKGLYEEAAGIMSAPQEDFVNKYSYIPLTVDISGKMKYSQNRKLGLWQSMDLWKALELDIIPLEQAKREVIRELSIEDEILYETSILLKQVDRPYLSQIIFAYKPFEKKNRRGLPPELAEYRGEYIRNAVADHFSMAEDKADILYAGTGSIYDTADFTDAGYTGVFVNNSGLTAPSDLERIYSPTGSNRSRQIIINTLNRVDYISWQSALRGENAGSFTIERKNLFSAPALLAVTAEKGTAEYPEGAYWGDISARLLKDLGVSVVLLPSSLEPLSRKRIITQLKAFSIDYAGIEQEGHEGVVRVYRNKKPHSDYTYRASVLNVSSSDELEEALKRARLKARNIIWNVPVHQLRDVSGTLYRSKSSSSGNMALDIINRRLDNSLHFLLNGPESDTGKITPAAIYPLIRFVEERSSELKKRRIGDILAKEKTLERMSEILSMLTLPFEMRESLVETADIKGIAADENRKRIGGIIIDDKAPDIGFEQQQVLLALYGKSSPIRQALADKLNTKIILYSQYTSKDYMPNMIAISNRRLEGAIMGLKRIEVVLNDYAGSFMPMGPNLVLAQQLLLYNIDKNNSDIRSNISNIYYMLSKKPMPDDIIEEFSAKGIFSLELPQATAVDRNYYSDLEKVSAYALIAA